MCSSAAHTLDCYISGGSYLTICPSIHSFINWKRVCSINLFLSRHKFAVLKYNRGATEMILVMETTRGKEKENSIEEDNK